MIGAILGMDIIEFDSKSSGYVSFVSIVSIITVK